MGQRNTPCNECRRHRRKCIRSSVSETCSRCDRLNRDCYTSSSSDCSSESEQDTVSVNVQVEQLHTMIADLERQITDLRLSQTAMDPLALTVSPNVQSNSRNATLNPGSWTLKISNGEFQIETGIRNISDLFLMQPIQYLSPINHLSDDQGSQGLVLYFDSEKLISLVPLTMRVLEDFMKQKPIQESLTVPTSILFDSHSIVDRLLETYFNCHNVYKPLIHKATFMKEYRQLNSPLDSLVCLCICSYVCAIPCEHTTNDFNELRYMGDYFYTLAKSKLIDQFDEPDKRLENVVCISLLTDYMHITLRLADCRRFASIAYQICYDLKNHYERSTNDHSSLVDQALFRRHFNEIMEMSQMMNFIGNESLDIFTYERLYWTHLPDELAQTIDFIEGQNWLFKLYNHPFINNIRIQISRIHLGAVCSLSFESIVRLDEMLKEWWEDLPEKYHFCDNWLDPEQCKGRIDETNDSAPLMMFIRFQIFTMDIYSCMLQPKALDSGNSQLLSIVQELMLERSLHCCQLVRYCVKKLSDCSIILPCHYLLSVSEYLFHTVDVLVMLTLSSNLTIKKEANIMLKSSLDEIDGMQYMELHKVDRDKSPLRGTPDGKLFNSIDLAFYDKYPRPWFAMILDACHYLAKM